VICRTKVRSTASATATATTGRSEAAQAGDTLAWAKREVLELVEALVTATDDDDMAAIQAALTRLTTATADPARRLALLLQLGVACAAIVDIAEFRHTIDRETLVGDLAPALRTCLVPSSSAGRCTSHA
jgi:hypothetical protein